MSRHDDTEEMRRTYQTLLNAARAWREELEARYGQVWDTAQLQEDFEVLGFLAPFVAVIRKRDQVKGSLLFQHGPRYYFLFKPDQAMGQDDGKGDPYVG